MAFRPGLDDDDGLKALLALWRDGSADLDSRLSDIHESIRSILRSPGSSSADAAIATRRLRIEAERVRELQGVATAIVDDMVNGTDRFIRGQGMDRIYAAGAGRVQSLPFSFSQPHRAAVKVIAEDTFQDVLRATSFIEDDAKDWVRDMSRRLTGYKLTGGTPVKAQAKRFEREITREFTRRGIGAVTYANGSRHSFGEYSEMLLRTKTGLAYNAGTMNQGRAAGIRFYELLDGANCGLVSHHDPELANGKIVPFEVAASFPLAHPNCRRSINPRPDLDKSNLENAVSIQAPEAREDQRQFEAALRAQQQRTARNGSRRQQRAPRQRPARPTRERPSRPSRAQQERQRARNEAARLRAQADNARAQARALRDGRRIADQRIAADGAGGNVDPGLLRRWGITERQFLNGRQQAKVIKRDIREVAGREADDVAGWLLDNDLADLSRPDRLKRSTDIFGSTSSKRQASGFDFLEGLDEAELARVRARMIDSDLYSPDLLAEQVRRKTNLDLSDDEAMEWLVDRWLHEDGLRSVASGRIPKYANVDGLIPADYGLEGYDLAKLFGVDLDEAAAHVARVQADEAATYAARTLGNPKVGRPPWEMDLSDYLRELEAIEDVLGSTTEGADPGPVFRTAQARLRELAPVEIDERGDMNPVELFERIRVTAQTAGLLP